MSTASGSGLDDEEVSPMITSSASNSESVEMISSAASSCVKTPSTDADSSRSDRLSMGIG